MIDFPKTISKTVLQVFKSLKTLTEAYVYTNINRIKSGDVYENEYITISGSGFFLNRKDNEHQIGTSNIPNRLHKTAYIFINSDDFKLNNPPQTPQISGKISVKGKSWSITDIDVSDFYFKIDLER